MGKASSIVVEANKPKRVVDRGAVENMWGGLPVISTHQLRLIL